MNGVVGVIPARWASVRFPGKNLADLAGKPLIQWVWERASLAKRLDSLLIATDDGRIADVVEGFGGKAVMTRGDHPSGTDRVAEAVDSCVGDIVVNIQGDEPVIDPSLIDAVADALLSDNQYDMATVATALDGEYERESPSVVKVVCDEKDRALYFSRLGIPCVRDPGFMKGVDTQMHWRHVGLYGYRRDFLKRLISEPVCMLEQAEKLEQLRALYIGGYIKVVKTDAGSVGVDTPDDIELAEQALRKAGLV